MQFKPFQLYSIRFNLIKQTFTDSRNLTACVLGGKKSVIKTTHFLSSRCFPLTAPHLRPMTIFRHTTELPYTQEIANGQLVDLNWISLTWLTNVWGVPPQPQSFRNCIRPVGVNNEMMTKNTTRSTVPPPPSRSSPETEILPSELKTHPQNLCFFPIDHFSLLFYFALSR